MPCNCYISSHVFLLCKIHNFDIVHKYILIYIYIYLFITILIAFAVLCGHYMYSSIT